MKKLIISISVALILFSSALFLLQENIVPLKSKRIRDVIGRNVEQKYFEKTDILIFGLKRFIGMNDRKISFLLKTMEPEWITAKDGAKKLRLFFADFVNTDPYCKRIRIVNPGLEILFSTAPRDVPQSRLNVNLYGSLFKDLPSNASRVVVDPIVEMLVFYKVIAGKKGERYAVLFYYSQDALEGVFAGVEGPAARSFLITSGKIVLVNFPEIDESEQVNLAKLVQAVGQSESGALRVIMKGMDKTIYYRRLGGQYTDWTMGLTLDTERLRISRIGVLILVVQALVVVSVILFILFSLSRRRTRRAAPVAEPPGTAAPAPSAGEEGPPETGGVAGAVELDTGSKEPAGASEAAGVAPLSDIEELVNVEVIGEAEVATLVEDAGEIEEAEAFVEGVQEETPGEVEELAGLEEGGAAPAPGYPAPEPGVVGAEGLEHELAEEVEALEELGETEEAAAVVEPAQAGMDEAIIDDRGAVPDGKAGKGASPGGKILPELEALVMAGKPVERRVSEVELPPIIPDSVYREKGKVNHEDELSALITEIESKEEAPRELKTPKEPKVLRKPEAFQEPKVLTEPFTAAEFEDLPDLRSPEGLSLFIKGVFRTIGVTKGALLTRSEGGLFEPSTIFGFSRATKRKLVFDGGESVYADFLERGKTLFILEKVFKSKEVAKKFDRADSAKIRSIVISPVVKAGEVKSILIAGVSKGKKVDQGSLIEKIKKIKEVIVRVY